MRVQAFNPTSSLAAASPPVSGATSLTPVADSVHFSGAHGSQARFGGVAKSAGIGLGIGAVLPLITYLIPPHVHGCLFTCLTPITAAIGAVIGFFVGLMRKN